MFNNPCLIEMIGNFTTEMESSVFVRWGWAELISVIVEGRSEL